MKYKSQVDKGRNKRVKLTCHVGRVDPSQLFNLSVIGTTNERKVYTEVETFDDGTEEEFLFFMQNLEQTIEDKELEAVNN